MFLTWYQSYCFEIFFAALSLFGVPCFRHHSHYCSHSPLNLWRLSIIVSSSEPIVAGVSHHKDHYPSITAVHLTPITFLQVPLWSSCPDLLICGTFVAIRDYTRRHALVKVLVKSFHALHVPPMLFWSCRRRYHWNHLFMIYIIKKESASSDISHASMRGLKFLFVYVTRLRIARFTADVI